jgi:hypothetical protein
MQETINHPSKIPDILFCIYSNFGAARKMRTRKTVTTNDANGLGSSSDQVGRNIEAKRNKIAFRGFNQIEISGIIRNNIEAYTPKSTSECVASTNHHENKKPIEIISVLDELLLLII